MDQLLDPSKYQRIYSIALDKSPWLNTSDTDIDDEETVSFFVLSNIIYDDDDDDIIGRIIEAYSKIRDANQGRSVHVSVKGQRYLVSFTDMIWGRMCVIAYYFYHADPIWKDMGGHDKVTIHSFAYCRICKKAVLLQPITNPNFYAYEQRTISPVAARAADIRFKRQSLL